MHTFKEHRLTAVQLRALCNESRIHLMLRLEEGPLCLRDIAAYLHIRPQNASKHVRKLINTEFVDGRRQGQTVEFFLTKKTRQSKFLFIVLKNGLF